MAGARNAEVGAMKIQTHNIICPKCRHGKLVEREVPAGRTLLLVDCAQFASPIEGIEQILLPCTKCVRFEPKEVEA